MVKGPSPVFERTVTFIVRTEVNARVKKEKPEEPDQVLVFFVF